MGSSTLLYKKCVREKNSVNDYKLRRTYFMTPIRAKDSFRHNEDNQNCVAVADTLLIVFFFPVTF